ncbi:MAG: hypothetical protein ACLS9G_00045 [Akkermansia sp.]
MNRPISTPPPLPDVEHYGTPEQFVPPLSTNWRRNTRAFDRTAEKKRRCGCSTVLKWPPPQKLSAGIAHELNNSRGVLSRKTDFVLKP